MKVRPAKPADSLPIATVHVRSSQAAYVGILSDDVLEQLSVTERAGTWRRTLLDDSAASLSGVLVLQTPDGAIAGFIHYCRSRDDDAPASVGEIAAIYIAPSFWKQGAGRKLLRSATDVLGAAGFTEATLWVLQRNERARRFYESLGWALDGGRKEIPGESARTEVRYRLLISDG